MQLRENPNIVHYGDGSEIFYDTEPNYSFLLTQHGLLGSTAPKCDGHSQFAVAMRLMQSGGAGLRMGMPEYLLMNRMVMIGNPGDVIADTNEPGGVRFAQLVDKGRIFPADYICSFWKLKLTGWLPAYVDLLAQYFRLLRLPMERFMFEAGDPGYQELVTFQQLRNPVPASEPGKAPEHTIDPQRAEMMNQLQAQIHVMPPGPQKTALRQRLDALRGPSVLAPPDRAVKAGFNSVAAFNHARRTGLGDSATRFGNLF